MHELTKEELICLEVLLAKLDRNRHYLMAEKPLVDAVLRGSAHDCLHYVKLVRKTLFPEG
jgi:hypothetical protein